MKLHIEQRQANNAYLQKPGLNGLSAISALLQKKIIRTPEKCTPAGLDDAIVQTHGNVFELETTELYNGIDIMPRCKLIVTKSSTEAIGKGRETQTTTEQN